MLLSLFITGLLATAQTPLENPAIPVAPAPMIPAPRSATPVVEDKQEESQKFLLMKLLDARSDGEFLDKSGITIKGYADMNYTASTAKGLNTPMAMNYKANQRVFAPSQLTCRETLVKS